MMAERYLDVYQRLLTTREGPAHGEIVKISSVDQLSTPTGRRSEIARTALGTRIARARVPGRAGLLQRSRRSACHPTRTPYPGRGAEVYDEAQAAQ
jgi:hypothetical protein